LFSELEASYENLVYACPFCNIAKSYDWHGDRQNNSIDGRGYTEPCDPKYEEQLTRLVDGRIKPLTLLGNYMFYKLNLGLRRRQHVWLLEEIRNLILEVRNLLKTLDDDDSKKIVALKDKYLELTACFFDIEKCYRDELV
jgi:hypothetical protein